MCLNEGVGVGDFGMLSSEDWSSMTVVDKIPDFARSKIPDFAREFCPRPIKVKGEEISLLVM